MSPYNCTIRPAIWYHGIVVTMQEALLSYVKIPIYYMISFMTLITRSEYNCILYSQDSSTILFRYILFICVYT